jgi:adenine-specific DNA-methyltransferase
VIKYLGSKRTLVPTIVEVVRSIPGVRTVVDLFAGTSRVGHALKAEGYRVLANDHAAYAATLARCYVEADLEEVGAEAPGLIAELDRLPGRAGYFTETFCRRSRFFQEKNGQRIDAIRTAIGERGLSPALEAVCLVSLMEAADRVDSTTGVQMAYLKAWAPRAHQDLRLRMPAVLPRARHGPGAATCLDAREAARVLEGDLAYLDPPYNQHAYLGNYHIWETLARGDQPEVYGRACKRVDGRQRRSPFNSRREFRTAFQEVIDSVRAPVIVASLSDEGYLTPEEMVALLSRRGRVTVLRRPYRRYVGAQIGIYNPKGQRVGQAGHLRNTEHLFICQP